MALAHFSGCLSQKMNRHHFPRAEENRGRRSPRYTERAGCREVPCNRRGLRESRRLLFLLGTDERKSRRGDWTPLELFVAGVWGWEAGIRRRLDVG